MKSFSELEHHKTISCCEPWMEKGLSEKSGFEDWSFRLLNNGTISVYSAYCSCLIKLFVIIHSLYFSPDFCEDKREKTKWRCTMMQNNWLFFCALQQDRNSRIFCQAENNSKHHMVTIENLFFHFSASLNMHKVFYPIDQPNHTC